MHAPVLVNRLSRLMGERRLTVSVVAEGAGVSRRAVHDLYHGKAAGVHFTTLNKLCAFLGVGPGDILEFRRTPDDPDEHPSSAGVVR